MPTPNPDILSMSDEDFAKLPPPADDAAATAPAPEPEPAPEPVPEAPAETPAAPEPEVKPEETPAPEETPVSPGSAPEPEPETKPEPEEQPAPTPEPKKEPDPEPEEPETPAAPDAKRLAELEGYEAFYKQVMAPFKANGKLIQLQSPEEVIQLMQMGANYTKKMQAIQPHKKLLMMLEQNGMLDENKLSFYIDLEKKNPDAIRKLLKDANIDPVDVDTSAEVNYKSGPHKVSDQEVHLQTALEELNSMDGGTETLQEVHKWDAASKKWLWDSPELLSVIHTQRGNGIYARISAEIERRRVLGHIGPNVPFLQAYKIVGDELNAKGAFQSAPTPAPAAAPQPVQARTPVAVRPAKTPSTTVANAQRVKAAAPTRNVSRPAKPSVNVLAMSDDEFMKMSSKV